LNRQDAENAKTERGEKVFATDKNQMNTDKTKFKCILSVSIFPARRDVAKAL
jgi:hypothetical protein